MLLVVCISLMFVQSVGADEDVKSSKPGVLDATHRQTGNLTPLHREKKIHLNTFCLDSEGNIVAAVGGSGFVYDADEAAGSMNGFLQTYSPEWKLLREIPLDFVPTAVNFDAAGYLYVGGDSVVCKFNPQGQLVQRTSAPNLGDPEAMRAKAEKMLATQQEQMMGSIKNTLAMAEKALKAKEKEAEQGSDEKEDANEEQDDADGEVNDRDNPFHQYPIEQLKMMVASYQEFLSENAAQFEPTEERINSMIRGMGRITSIAVGDQDVYVTCPAATGFGYDVWRLNLDLQEPVVVKERLSGCCGQMDIQAVGDKLVIAENTRFRVGIYDRDGKPLLDFGKQDRRGEKGFGSCCNPMNTRCLPNGEILTAESSIGTIKRFDAEGNLVGTVGRARIGGGCKHVALGYDPNRDRYYVMYQDESSICVLEPISADRPESEEERLAREAAEGLGKILVGNWKRIATDSDADAQKRMARNEATVADFYGFSEVTFEANGGMAVQGGRMQQADQVLKWIPVSQKESELVAAIEIDLVNTYNLVIQFENDVRAEIFLQFGAREAHPQSLGKFEKVTE
ncbi:MAG TPA: hypothetical protein PKD54_01550 [Pirellulaceae bacterium]|nr:hypothetical protein [Pirellulaceae bacterium]